jgi:AbrB family looped-hinge helix DNA binding protein
MAKKLTTTISNQGRITLPKHIRQKFRWKGGTRLVVEDTPNGVLLKATPFFAPTHPEDVFGSLAYSGRPKTLKEMEAGIAVEAKRRHARSRC